MGVGRARAGNEFKLPAATRCCRARVYLPTHGTATAAAAAPSGTPSAPSVVRNRLPSAQQETTTPAVDRQQQPPPRCVAAKVNNNIIIPISSSSEIKTLNTIVFSMAALMLTARSDAIGKHFKSGGNL